MRKLTIDKDFYNLTVPITEEEKKVCEAVTGFKYEDLWKESNGISFK